MVIPRPLIAVFIAILSLAPVGIVWATQATTEAPTPHGTIQVVTDRDAYKAGDTVRVWIRNAGDHPLDGSPRLWILTQEGGMQQSFGFGEFKTSLAPGESVWVDWATSPKPTPCMYGTADVSGAPSAGIRYPCPVMGDTAGASSDMMPCSGCGVWRGSSGTFVLVGLFANAADAHTVELD